MKRIDYGIRVIVDEMFLVIMVLLLALVIAVFLFGNFLPPGKPAYIVPRSGISTVSGHPFITIFDSGGEPVSFNRSRQARYHATVYVDTQSGSFRAVPSPTLAMIKPGDTVYAWYTGYGFALTDSMDGITPVSFPAGKISVRLVDPVSGFQISREDLSL